jgi:hypothetical protein
MRKKTYGAKKRSKTTGRATGSSTDALGAKKDRPNDTKDDYSKADADAEQHQYAGPGLSLARLGWRLNNAPVFAFCHRDRPLVVQTKQCRRCSFLSRLRLADLPLGSLRGS